MNEQENSIRNKIATDFHKQRAAVNNVQQNKITVPVVDKTTENKIDPDFYKLNYSQKHSQAAMLFLHHKNIEELRRLRIELNKHLDEINNEYKTDELINFCLDNFNSTDLKFIFAIRDQIMPTYLSKFSVRLNDAFLDVRRIIGTLNTVELKIFREYVQRVEIDNNNVRDLSTLDPL